MVNIKVDHDKIAITHPLFIIYYRRFAKKVDFEKASCPILGVQYSSNNTVFCLHGCQSPKNRVSGGLPVHKILQNTNLISISYIFYVRYRKSMMPVTRQVCPIIHLCNASVSYAVRYSKAKISRPYLFPDKRKVATIMAYYILSKLTSVSETNTSRSYQFSISRWLLSRQANYKTFWMHLQQ